MTDTARTDPTARRRPVRWTLKLIWRLARLAMFVVGIAAAALVLTPAVTAYDILVIKSGSMGSTAPTGSAVMVKPLAAKDVKVGDVVLIARKRDGKALTPVLHRVVERSVENGQIVVRTKGDANKAVDHDRYVISSRTFTPVLVVPRVGFAIAFLRTPLGWFGLIIGPAMLFTVVAIYHLWDTDDDKAEPEPEADPEVESAPSPVPDVLVGADVLRDLLAYKPVSRPRLLTAGRHHRSRFSRSSTR